MQRPLKRLAALSAVTLVLLAIPALPVSAEAKTAAPAIAATAINPYACGVTRIAKLGGGYWTCTFADDFNSRSLDTSKWVAQKTSNSGYHSGPECFVDSGKNVSVSGGLLNLTVKKEPKPFVCTSPYGNYTTQYTSGSVSTWGKFAQAYGRFEIRAKFPAAKVAGLQSALWLWPQESKYGGWPNSGEIDIAEFYSKYPDRAIPYIHYVADTLAPTVTNNHCMIANVSAFHTYVAEWTPTSITIKYDGATCLVHPLENSAPFDQPFIIVLTQALGVGENAFDPATTPLPATTQVDYVRAWS